MSNIFIGGKYEAIWIYIKEWSWYKTISKKLAAKLKPKDVVVLTGELGSGKTKFTEGFLSYFGLENEISSPTFTIVNEYKKMILIFIILMYID